MVFTVSGDRWQSTEKTEVESFSNGNRWYSAAMATKFFRYNLDIEVPDIYQETAIWEVFEALQSEAQRLSDEKYFRKAKAVDVKWFGLHLLRSEITALDKLYGSRSALAAWEKSLLVSKLENFLSTARAILDILVYCLLKSLSLQGGDQSFNDLRKRRDLPAWLAEHISLCIAYDASVSMSKNGWLLMLVTEKTLHGKSLRDFAIHQGTINFISVEQFERDEEDNPVFRLAIEPREGDAHAHHLEDIVNRIHGGIDQFFRLLVQHLPPSQKN